MSVVVARTNQLCANCLYLPAEDLESNQCEDRITAIECNDLCYDCVRNPKLPVIGIKPSKEVCDRVMANSPWHKAHPEDLPAVKGPSITITSYTVTRPNPFKDNSMTDRAKFMRQYASSPDYIKQAWQEAGLTSPMDFYIP